MKSILFISLLLTVGYSILGFDISTTPSVETLKCLREDGRTFIIARAWRSFGAFDANVLQTINNSLAAGFSQD